MVAVTVDNAARIGSGDAFVGTQSPAQVPTGARYTVVCTYDAHSKLITSITVTTNKTTPSNPT
jgi:azurin